MISYPGSSVVFRRRKFIIGHNYCGETGNFNDKSCSNCRNMNIKLRDYRCNICFKEEDGKIVEHVLPVVFLWKYLSTVDVKASSTAQNDSTHSVISGIATSFLFNNIEPNDASIKSSTQYQFSKYSPGRSFFSDGRNII